MNYKISVIVPVYNVEKYLDRCMESITNQTLKDIEIICVNDGSTDNSKSILEKYKNNDERITIIDKSNRGYGSACNTGLRLAKGEYISIIEPDDFINENMYSDLYNIAAKNNADIVKSAFYEYVDSNCENGESATKINWSDIYKMPTKIFKINEFTQFLYFHPSIWSCIYKREFLTKNSVWFVEPKGAGWADNPFQVKTLCLAQRIFYTDTPYYYYRLNNPNSSSNIVNFSNPFDRSEEIHNFLREKRIKDKNILAHLYKRELGYIEIILKGIDDDLFEKAYYKINEMTRRMDETIIRENKFINSYERDFYEKCKTDKGVKSLMEILRQDNKSLQVTTNE